MPSPLSGVEAGIEWLLRGRKTKAGVEWFNERMPAPLNEVKAGID